MFELTVEGREKNQQQQVKKKRNSGVENDITHESYLLF